MIEKWLVFSFAVLFMGCAGNRPTTLGVKEGKFIPCPASPNCVSSQSERPAYAIEPLAYKGSPDDARTHLLEVILSMKRSKLVAQQERYIRAEFTSAVFRFIDDAEFFIDDDQKVIHVRSAARLGYSDFGVNRKRIETIRKLFNLETP
jgi:uncharacterized protein (DUF1499 family)